MHLKKKIGSRKPGFRADKFFYNKFMYNKFFKLFYHNRNTFWVGYTGPKPRFSGPNFVCKHAKSIKYQVLPTNFHLKIGRQYLVLTASTSGSSKQNIQIKTFKVFRGIFLTNFQKCQVHPNNISLGSSTSSIICDYT